MAPEPKDELAEAVQALNLGDDTRRTKAERRLMEQMTVAQIAKKFGLVSTFETLEGHE